MIHPASALPTPFPLVSRLADAAAFRLAPLGTDGPELEALSSADVAARLAGRRVLLVEDEVIVALELSLELEDQGAEVVGPAHSLPDAAAVVEAGLAGAGGIDAAILDVDLQGEEVYPVAERLMRAGVPFLFHTGHGDRAELRERFDGAPVCTKPTLSEELVAKLATIIG